MSDATSRGGLEGVVVADTVLSDVDGEKGRLVLRGHDVEALAPQFVFEDAVGLFLDGAIPDALGRERIREALGRARASAFARIGTLGSALQARDGMDALRGALAQLEPEGTSRDTAIALIGATAVYAAAWSRRVAGQSPVQPDTAASHVADYLRMVRGEASDAARTRALETYLVTVTDHGMNASTFAARVVASTGSDSVSAGVAAVGALKGPLHGGAPGPVLDMLDAIADPSRAEPWLESELGAGRRIMGMGHRIYRVRDPRAAVLEGAVERLEASGVRSGRLALARAVERAAVGVLRARHPDRPLHANVEFYTAVLLDAVGLPRTLFTPTFAVGRMVGWMAHVEEQRATGRLIRPASRYVGSIPAGGAA
jgi:citrate synthase